MLRLENRAAQSLSLKNTEVARRGRDCAFGEGGQKRAGLALAPASNEGPRGRRQWVRKQRVRKQRGRRCGGVSPAPDRTGGMHGGHEVI